MQKKKVVYLLRTLNLGGAERYVVETATGLNRDVFDPKIYCISGGGELKKYAEQHGVDVTIFQTPHCDSLHIGQHLLWRSRKFFALYQYLQKEQPDIVHSYTFTPSVYGGIAAKMAGETVIITNRMSLGNFKDHKPHYQLLENILNRFIDGVLVNSLAVKADVLEREHISPKKVHVIYGGVDTRKYMPTEKSSKPSPPLLSKKREFRIPEEAPVIAMIANLRHCKGYLEFIQAASVICRNHYPEARFLCIGEDRGMQKQLEKLRDELGLQEHVIFTGQIRNIVELFPIVDIQVSASYEEGFSSAIIEGMASGKPIIATEVGGSPEAVVPGETGILIPPHNSQKLAQAIQHLLDDPERMAIFGRNGRTRVEQYFSTQMMNAKLEAFYLTYFERAQG